MSELNDILLRSSSGASDPGPRLLGRLGVGRRADERGTTGAGDLERLAGSGVRIAQAERLAAGETRLRRAAEALSGAAPESLLATETVGRQARVERVARSERISVEQEITTPAGPALQFSFAFAAPDINAVGSSGQIRLGVVGPNIRIDVPSGGATLEELATLINNELQNLGRVLATVVESEGSYRLRVETTAVGSDQRLRIRRDDFGLFDPALEQLDGRDESTETVTVEEERISFSDVVTYEDIETAVLVDDEAFQALSEELVVAFNALRAELGIPGFGGGVLAGDARSARREALRDALTELSAGLDSRLSTSGTALSELGLEATPIGDLRLDGARLQRALGDRPVEAIELIASGPESLARNLTSLLGGASTLISGAAAAASELATRGRLDQLGGLLAVQRDAARGSR